MSHKVQKQAAEACTCVACRLWGAWHMGQFEVAARAGGRHIHFAPGTARRHRKVLKGSKQVDHALRIKYRILSVHLHSNHRRSSREPTPQLWGHEMAHEFGRQVQLAMQVQQQMHAHVTRQMQVQLKLVWQVQQPWHAYALTQN